MATWARTWLTRLTATGCCAALAGCAGPWAVSNDAALREQVLRSYREHLEAAAPGGVQELTRKPSEVENDLTEERRTELNQLSGPNAYQDEFLNLGYDLMGAGMDPEKLVNRNLMAQRLELLKKKPALTEQEEKDVRELPAKIAEIEAEARAIAAQHTVGMTLRRVINLTVNYNLDLQVARIIPAIAETQITQAEAVFDATFFANYDFQKLDTPQPPTDPQLAVFGTVMQQTETLNTGIRKILTTGGQIVASTQFSRQFRDPSFFSPVDTFRDSNVLFSIQQPLLRNFGADVTRAQIMLSKSSRQQTVQDLRQRMIDTVRQSEAVYWALVLARYRLLIQARLVERTIRERDIIKARMGVDATEADLAEANSFVETRRADLIIARQNLRIISDTLKRLLNSPDLPLAAETVILPLEKPADLPVQMNLLDAVTTALQRRPELQSALLQIKDASIRQRVADNQRLPQLDLSATVRYNGVGASLTDSYDVVRQGDFIDYLVGLQFEVPIGNRGPEALFQQRRLEKQASTINYQRLSRETVQDVKDAMRNLITAYELIGARRGARLAAADNIRAIRVQEEQGQALTPEFVDRKLRRLGELSQTEIDEVRALTDYNTALSQFYATTATLLERNGIEFQDSRDPDD